MSYKLIYFNARGRAEATRLALAAAGVEYEDIRLEGESWKKVKEERKGDIFLGQLPVLEVKDGGEWKVIPESGAMIRYVARAHGLYGNGNLENSMVDAVIFQTEEIIAKHLLPMFIEKDEDKKKSLTETFHSETLPMYLVRFEKFLDKNGGNTWMVGNKMTIADISLFSLLHSYKDTVQKHSAKIFAHYNRVASEPKIKAWLDKRPETQF